MESPFSSPLSSVTASPAASPWTSPFGSPLSTPPSFPPPSSAASSGFSSAASSASSSPAPTRPSSPLPRMTHPPTSSTAIPERSSSRKRAFSLSLYDSSDDTLPETTSKEPRTKKKRGSGRRAHQQEGYRKRRAWNRQCAKQHPSTQRIRASLPANHPDLTYLPTNFNVADLKASKPGFIGVNIPRVDTCRTLQDYRDEGFEVIEWDGKSVHALLL